MSRIYLSVSDKIFSDMLRVELSGKAEVISGPSKEPVPPCAVVCSPDRIPAKLPEGDITLIVVGYGKELEAAVIPPTAVVLHRPFDIGEFLSVIFSDGGDNAPALRKISPAERITLDPALRTVSLGTAAVKLTKREFSLFEYLYSHRGTTLSRSEIYRDVWGGGGDENVVDVYICYLRGKLSRAFGINLLSTSRGKGYSLEK